MIRMWQVVPFLLLLDLFSAFGLCQGRMIIDMGDATFTNVRNRAQQIIDQDGTGLGHNSSTTPDSQSFTVPFIASANTTRLASFSDDQVEVYITDESTGETSPRLSGILGQGQALPDLNQSLRELSYTFQAGGQYSVRVEYRNVVFTGAQDIDGVVLFAYSGGGFSPSLRVVATGGPYGVTPCVNLLGMWPGEILKLNLQINPPPPDPLPSGFITWSATSVGSPPDNTLEYQFTRTTDGIESFEIQIPS